VRQTSRSRWQNSKIGLTRDCQGALDAAQARVEILLKRDGEPRLETFAAEDDGEQSE